MIAKGSLTKGSMICVGCGHPVAGNQQHRGLPIWLRATILVLVFLVLAGLPILLNPRAFSERDGRPFTEQLSTE
jgi:hypothetical protein